jgi:hypothetical protein
MIEEYMNSKQVNYYPRMEQYYNQNWLNLYRSTDPAIKMIFL